MLYDINEFVKLMKWGVIIRVKLCVYILYNIFFFLKLCVVKVGDLGLVSEKEVWCVDFLILSDKYLFKVIF